MTAQLPFLCFFPKRPAPWAPSKIFQCHSPNGIKLVTRLKLGLSHLPQHKLKYSFQDTLNPLCSCCLNIETTSHYFLHFHLFHAEWSTLLNNINEIDSTILNKSESFVMPIMLYSEESFKDEVNFLMLNATIDFVSSTNRFDEPLYLLWIHRCFSFYSWLYGYNFTVFKISILCLVITCFVFLAPIMLMVPGNCCFNVYCVNVNFHWKKEFY